MATSESDERDPPGAQSAALFDSALDAPLTESRLRAIERTHILTTEQMSRAAEIVGGPLPAVVWAANLQRVLLLAAAGHVVAGLGLLLVEVWEDLGQLGSVALAAAVTIAPALAARRVGLTRVVGRSLLTAAALLCIPLVVVLQLAYPLPASSWIVPALVVVLAIPFAMAARSGVTWLVPLGALHVSAALFLEEAGDVDEVAVWLMTSGLAAGSWLVWSGLARGVPWMRGRLVPRVEGTLAVLAATVVSVRFVVPGAWFGDVDPVQGSLATTTLVAAAAALMSRALTARGDLLLAAVAIVGVALVGAVGVVRLLDDVAGLPIEFALAIGGIGLVAATAVAVWILRKSVQARGDA